MNPTVLKKKALTLYIVMLFFVPVTLLYGADFVVEEGNITQTQPGSYVVDGNTAVSGSFNINEAESLTFQGINNAQLIWHDQSGLASQINGALHLKDIVFALINQMGINIGANGSIDARSASLILSSLKISNPDFFNKNYKFDSE